MGQDALLCNVNGGQRKVKITNLYQFEGLKRTAVDTAKLGDIIAVRCGAFKLRNHM